MEPTTKTTIIDRLRGAWALLVFTSLVHSAFAVYPHVKAFWPKVAIAQPDDISEAMEYWEEQAKTPRVFSASDPVPPPPGKKPVLDQEGLNLFYQQINP